MTISSTYKARKRGKNFNGYVFGFSVRGGTKAFKEYVLSDEGYLDKDGRPADESADFRVKTRVIARDINVTTLCRGQGQKDGLRKASSLLGRKYAEKARAERNGAIGQSP